MAIVDAPILRSPRNARRSLVQSGLLLGLIAVVIWSTAPLHAVTELNRGEAAARISLPTLEGVNVDTTALQGEPIVVIFGELYHDKTIQACREYREIAAHDAFVGKRVMPFLIITQDVPVDLLQDLADDLALDIPVLHDPERQAYEAYRVAVLPSVVVIDAEGQIVHAIAAHTTGFKDQLMDAMLFAVGSIDAEQFAARLAPERTEARQTNLARAQRLTHMADQLAKQNLIESAIARYAEAIELHPGHVPAEIGLGTLRLRQHRVAEAEPSFRRALAVDPDSVPALLGLAYIQMQRGGEEVHLAEKLAHRAIANAPLNPRAHYLMGRIREQQERMDKAAASYREAAELLLDQRLGDLEP